MMRISEYLVVLSSVLWVTVMQAQEAHVVVQGCEEDCGTVCMIAKSHSGWIADTVLVCGNANVKPCVVNYDAENIMKCTLMCDGGVIKRNIYIQNGDTIVLSLKAGGAEISRDVRRYNVAFEELAGKYVEINNYKYMRMGDEDAKREIEKQRVEKVASLEEVIKGNRIKDAEWVKFMHQQVQIDAITKRMIYIVSNHVLGDGAEVDEKEVVRLFDLLSDDIYTKELYADNWPLWDNCYMYYLKKVKNEKIYDDVGVLIRKVYDDIEMIVKSKKWCREARYYYILWIMQQEQCGECYRDIMNLYCKVNDEYTNELMRYVQQIEEDKNVAKNIIAENEKGDKATLYEQTGKYILLEFWGTWCGACMRDIDSLREICMEMKRIYGEDFAWVSVACENKGARKRWKKVIVEKKMMV